MDSSPPGSSVHGILQAGEVLTPESPGKPMQHLQGTEFLKGTVLGLLFSYAYISCK